MGGRRNMHAYNQDEIDRLKGIPLPIKIKCGRCQKNLPQAKYSTKQLTDARWQIKNSAKIYKAINCQACTGQQKVEVECTMCGKTKGLEEFAKSQRAKPDTAKCFKCIEAQLADEAVDEDRYENLENAFLPADHSNGQYPEYFSSATTDTSSNYGDDEWQTVNGGDRRPKHKEMTDGGIALSADSQEAMSMTGSADESLIETEYTYAAAAGHGKGNSDGGWSEQRTKSWHTKSNAAPSTSSGFNPNAYRRPASSVTGSDHSFASSVAEHSDISDVRPSGWAKIRAAPRGPPMMPMGDIARQTGSDLGAWDSDDDEEENDEDDDDDSDDDTII